jgi:hypothetical protein
MLGANRKSVTLAAQSMQHAGLISYHRGRMQVLDRAGLEQASCECYAVVKQRFDAFLKPPSTAVQDHNRGRSKSRPGRTGETPISASGPRIIPLEFAACRTEPRLAASYGPRFFRYSR